VAFIKLATNQAPPVIGAWCLIGIVAASMSTADGAILAMGTVASHNLMRMLDVKWPGIVTAKNLLMVARLSTIPFTLASTMIGAYYRSSDSAAGATGYLLIVAFDIVLATVVAPLFGCFYAKNPSPRAAFCSVICGAIVRILLEFLLPKVSRELLTVGSNALLCLFTLSPLFSIRTASFSCHTTTLSFTTTALPPV
jgi:Na+/proline symporter